MIIAVFCPRHDGETEESWKKRYDLCRRLARTHTRAQCIDLFDLYDLQCLHVKTPLSKVIVARLSYYDLNAQTWLRNNRIDTEDVMNTSISTPSWMTGMQR